ncbi:hypothetical protein [Pseudomonas carnis]|uniref:hypothetical protein n=1 Tax=Pseudomonas TaxID=286 RepID=UPI00244C2A6A|nr:hypothetical protein [Pseudomonas carnis]MDH0797582.1 hypothetical protein [Pseudomonas carnis]
MQKLPSLTVTADQVIADSFQGSISVKGCTLVISGSHQGSLAISEGAMVEVYGAHQGSTSISGDSKMVVSGTNLGSVTISSDSELVVEFGGKHTGSVGNEGRLIIRGTFGGSTSGSGAQTVEEGGYIKAPRIENGIHYYDL